MFSTKIKTLFSLAIAFCAVQLSAQSPNTMTITSPMSLAGDYPISSAGFGLEPTSAISGTLALGTDDTAPENDACTALTNDLSGFIGLIDRGMCPFVEKMQNAQNANAVAVLVCNNVPGETIVMGADDPPVIAPTINIYGAMATQQLCNEIKAELQDGPVEISFSFQLPPCSAEYDSTVVWGQFGEGAFDNGLGDWVTAGVSAETTVWTHAPTGYPGGAIWGPNSEFIVSPTVCNGAAIIDYDFLSTGGTDAGLNANSPALQHTSQLISPSIDLTGVDNPVVEFYQFNMPLNGDTFFAYSIDGGNTYSDEVVITTENVWTASLTNYEGTEFRSVSIQEAGGQSDVRLRFTSNEGDYYFWMIDDVIVRNQLTVDIRANTNFYSVYNNYQTPADQVDAMPFLIDIENIGNVDLDDVRVDATITNEATGDVVHEQSLDYGTVAFGFLDENRVFSDTWTPDAEVANYTGNYTVVTGNANEDTSNNSIDFNFEITEDRFAKVQSEEDAGGEYLGARAAPDQYFQSYGNYYYVPNGAGLSVDQVSFGVEIEDIANSSGFITLEMFQWNNSNADTEDFPTVSPDERVSLGTAEILVSEDITAAELRNMTFNLRTPAGGPIELTNDAHYLLMAHMRPLSTNGSQYRIVAANTGVETNFSYGAMSLALDQEFGIGRYGSFSGSGSDFQLSDVENRDFNQNGAWSVYMPLTIGVYSDVDDLNKDLNVKVFPNPASDRLIVDLILENNSEVVSFNLTNIDGKVILNERANNVQYDKVELNISNVPSGIYMLNVITEDGFINKKVVVSK